MVTLEDILEAQIRLRGVAVHTPLLESHIHQAQGGADGRRLYLKPENLQPIGAFKLRGAYNKIASLTEEERRRGIITYSSGNHGQGVAYAARALGAKAVITMPTNAPAIKQLKAEELAAQHGYIIVPPFNDEKIIAGQGTIGLEILEDLPEVETVLVPVGGGGLISGVATALKLSKPQVKVIGVEPALGADAQASLRAGKIVRFPAEQVTQTIADGLRAQYVGEINFEHIRRYVDDIVSVSEDEIREATRRLAEHPKTLAEPSGAVTTAAFLFHPTQLPQTKMNVAVISGGNIDPEMLAEIRRGES
jgi:threonine dehydratase